MRNERSEMKNKTNDDSSNTYRTKMDQLSKPVRQRLKWIEHFQKYRNARLTCRHFGISPDTFYLWKKRFDANNLNTLEDDTKTRRPHTLRKPKYTPYQAGAIHQLKQINPKIGKMTISRILKEIDSPLSPSTITRILSTLNKNHP